MKLHSIVYNLLLIYQTIALLSEFMELFLSCPTMLKTTFIFPVGLISKCRFIDLLNYSERIIVVALESQSH